MTHHTSLLLAFSPGPGLMLGLILLAAIIGGYVAHFVHLPRVIGYLVGGFGLRLCLKELVDVPDSETAKKALEAAVVPLSMLTQLAVGVILFNLGSVFEPKRMKLLGAKMLRVSMTEITCCVLFVFIGCGAVALWIAPEQETGIFLVLAVLLAIGAIETAPAATLLTLQEYESKGEITDTILGMTGINNTVCVIAFYTTFLSLASLGLLKTSTSLAQHLWLELSLMTVGSVVLGMVCGLVLSVMHAKLSLPEVLLVFLALFILLGEGQSRLLQHLGVSYNYLLTALATGAVFANLAIDSGRLSQAIGTLGSPLFAAFFVMAGYKLHVNDFLHMGWLGIAYVVCRLLAKVAGCYWGLRWADRLPHVRWHLGSGMLCQATVVIGLSAFVLEHWESPLARQFATVVLGSVVVFELIGPLLTKRCVVRGGEVKASTLLRRTGPDSEDTAIVPATLQSFKRLLTRRPARSAGSQQAELTAKDIMRSNVQLVPAAMTFDEVLHFIERSTYDHFPVVDEKGRYVGMIHFSDIRGVIYDPMVSELVTAIDIADMSGPAVHKDMPLSELLEVFTKHNVGVVPVVDQASSKRIIGLVEQRDLLKTLRSHQK